MFFDFFSFFFSSQNFTRGGALAPCIDAPPLMVHQIHDRCGIQDVADFELPRYLSCLARRLNGEVMNLCHATQAENVS